MNGPHMPIESMSSAPSEDRSIGAEFLAGSRSALAGALKKIEHCIAQLKDSDPWWRQFESHNSIQTVILHLCGNLRQWILHGVGGEPDVRSRPLEFSDRQERPKAELLAMFRETVAQCDQVLAAFPAGRLLEKRRIQGFD